MLNLDYEHIIRVYGIAPGDTPVLMVMELATMGALPVKIRRTMEPSFNLINKIQSLRPSRQFLELN